MEAGDGSKAAEDPSADGSGSYILRDLIKDIPLTTDDESGEAHITCADVWNGNVYIGTSTGEVLHYVSIPPDPADESGEPAYIFATKLEPPFTTKQEGRDAGVKQILVLPTAGKACILCNGTLTFYTLPELSPAYGERVKQAGCTWVGGLDANLAGQDIPDPVVVICLKQRLRLIRIGREARKVRDIELGNVSAIERRDDLACVADANTYALLDVVNHRKNDLFPISSLSASAPVAEKPLPELPQQPSHGASRSVSAASPSPTRQPRSHERNASLGAAPQNSSQSPAGWPARASSRQMLSPAQPASRENSPAKPKETSPRQSTDVAQRSEPTITPRPLPPNIASPTPNEYLLTTGTKLNEPGVGMFINLDGDISPRGTIEFSSYPQQLVLDGTGQGVGSETAAASDSEGYVLALVRPPKCDDTRLVIEVQRWDLDPSQADRSKDYIAISSSSRDLLRDVQVPTCGLRIASSMVDVPVPEVKTSLRLRRLSISNGDPDASDKRNVEEDKIAARYAQVQAHVLLYSSNQLRWVIRSPLLIRLDRQLGLCVKHTESKQLSIDAEAVQRVLNSIRGQDARNELEFLTLTYIRQKASLLLFGNLLIQTYSGVIAYERDKRMAEEALTAGEIDPRVVLTLIPSLESEIQQGEHSIWLSQGVRDTVSLLRNNFDASQIVADPRGAYGDNLLTIIKRLLFSWRKKKGFGSVADETHVFQSVDAALLHVLLLLDQNSPRGPASAGSVRAELNGVVDRGVDCFDRAVTLFQQFERLYLLSRLYQSRKMVDQVLSTWRRILEGERDAGGELIEGEQDLRRYLTNIRDQSLVQEYGAWLANRNPALGVQVFADDASRVKFQPAEAVALLKEKAPGAVKAYLEHLVFGKNQLQYANDLIAFYFDTVLTALEASTEAKDALLHSYEAYRALRPPKPTYRHFIEDNAIDAEWWRSRLRLLQLIGGSHGAGFEYDVHTLRERLAPYSDELVPEMIILNGQEGKHEEALRLLTHGLGDYDTAIRYCLLGGSSIFHPGSGFGPAQPMPSKGEQAELFEHLLHQFLKIEDLSERLERTAELLERFGGWFDIAKVLALIPDSWSVELVSGFLIHALRSLVTERNETTVTKALASAQNLKKSVDCIEKTESLGPTITNVAPTIDVT